MLKRLADVCAAILCLAVAATPDLTFAEAAPQSGDILAQLAAMTDASYADPTLNTADLTYENNAAKAEKPA